MTSPTFETTSRHPWEAMAQRCEDLDGHDEATPPFLKRYFQRLHEELPEYEFTEDFVPFHSSYDNWHFLGKRRRKLASTASTSSGSRPQSTRSQSDYSESKVGDLFVIARVSAHNLRLEREFQICQHASTNSDPEGKHFVRPVTFARLPARQPGEERLSVSLVEAPGRNYLRNMTSFGPNFYNGAPIAYSPSAPLEKVSLPCFLSFAIGAAECLELLHHSENLVHGELRGDAFHYNRETGAVRLVNFGSGAKAFADGLTSAGWAGLVKQRGIEHKLQFIAPEQTGRLGAAEPDSRTDVYSLGILFYSMLVGKAVFEGKTPLDIMQAVLSRRGPSVTTIRPDVPDALAAVISKMTAKQMDERYKSITGAKMDLLAINKALEDGDHDTLAKFKVGANDISCFFTLPTHLVGREAQRSTIIDVIQRASLRSSRAAPIQRKGLYSLSSSSFSMMSGERADISTLDEMMSDSTSSGGADRDRDSRLNSTLEIEPREHQKSGSLDTIGSAGSSGRGTHNDMRPYDNASSHGSRESNHDGHDMSTTQHPQLSETSSVLRTAQKLKNRGRIEIIAVGGVAGLGKSSLVHSIAPVARKTGYYASAKFDQVRVSPFDGLIRVMSSLFKQIFSEPNVGTQFHENIRSFVKPFWGILHQSLELPPWLLSPGTTGRESVLQANQQSTTPGHDKERKACNNSQSAQDWLRSGGSSKTSRFMHVYLDVLRLLAFQKVLTLTLDDLQFADVESQDLLIMIVAARIPVILILTHRGEESLPQSMRKLLERATKVELGPFTDDDTGRFVAETIGRGEEYCLPLTAVIFEKTRGNPFFVRECLNLAYQKGAIYYSWESARFEFSMDKLFSDFSSPDPGAYSSKDFIVRKIKALPMDAQTLLAWASIIGNTFNFKLVQQVMSCECSRMSPPELKPPNSGDVVAGLQACVNAFMLSATEDDERFKFSHDRYVTAADSLCEPFDRQEMHYIIASSMMKHAPFDTVLHPNKYLYEQARHICEALNVIKKRASAKAPYRQLLYQAAECARDDGARGSSLNYFRCCLDLLPEKPWIESSDDGTYVETLTVMTKAAEAAWVVGDYKEAGVLLSEIHRHGRNATDRAPATILQSRILAQQGKGRDAFLLLREALAEMGGHLPTTSYEECDEEFQRLLPLVQERRADIAAAHSPNASNDTQTLGALLTELLSVSYWSDALLFYQTTLVFMAIFAERGFFAQAPLGLIHFSSIAMDRFHLILSAVDLGNRALEALQGYDYDYYTAGRGLTMHTLFLGHLSTNWRESFSALNQGSEAASAAGDKGLHLLNIGITAAYQVWSSFDLVEVEAFVGSVDDVYEDWAESTRGGVFLVAVRQFSRAMQGKTYARTSTDVLGDENHSSEQYEKFLLENSSEPNRPMTFYNSYKLNALYRFGHYAEAVALGEKMMQYMGDTGCVPYVYQNYCYVALALLALVREKPFDWPAREKMLQRVAEYRSRIELVASFDSVNYLTMLKILEAEIADVRGEYGDVLHSYEAAINNASLHECLMEYSLATELYADFLERRGASRPSRGVVLDAVSAYRRIGAFGKADALAQRYEFILLGTRSLSACDAGTQTNEDTGATTYQIDKIEVEESSADRTQEWLHPALPATTPSGGSSRDPQIALSGGLSAGGLDMIDLASILESSQLLSSELNVEKLLKRLTEIVVDSTGADRCGLIVEQDGGGWCVAAVGVPDGTEPPPSGMLLDEIDDPVAKQITLYVLRFKEAVFVKNVLEDERFANVPPAWLASNPEGASLIALPILHGNDTLLGSLFVEGGPNTFSERTVTLLKLLVNQLTISIANALLFKQVERVSARNASMLEVQKQALTQAREAEKKAKDAEAKATENAKAKSMFLANVSHELRTP